MKSSVDKAVKILLSGGIVGFPTETYYGLAVDAFNESALKKLYKLKQRDSKKAMLVIIEDFDDIDTVAASVPEEYLPLIKKYWPGALTLIFPALDGLSSLLTGQSETIGVRVSPHPVAQALVREMKKPITATSANIAGEGPAKSAFEVRTIFGNGVDFVLDGGETVAGNCSTIVGLKNMDLIVLREGIIDVTSFLPNLTLPD